MKSLLFTDLELVKEATIQLDILRIQRILERSDHNEDDLINLHVELDGKYQVKIEKWSNGMCDYNPHSGFNYKYIDEKSLLLNLRLMKSKLEGFVLGFNDSTVVNSSKPSTINIEPHNTVSNMTTVSIIISIEEAKHKIDEILDLSDLEIKEIKSKLDNLEQIMKENSPRKTKWEKIKPILSFALDKGFDVAIVFIEFYLPKLLGM